ncbi:hypothetical protein [Halorubellus salinus]|uniref:hypothetical protein n=1 Tax=Halorubellus salinus TaxID=755309 RepID=UPI001D078FA0|nr:hypothetical protein [Halorubellus salinus]
MGARLIMVGVVVALAVVGGLVATAPTSTAAASSSCNQTVTHDAYRTDAAIATVNETGEATSTVENTQTRLEDVTGFVRLHASNPNGYCVRYRVEISPEVVSAADLGEIEGQNGNATASWRAAQNLTSGEVYTSVEFVLEPGESALFAPSQARVTSLAWTGEAKRESQGLFSSVTSFLAGDSKLEQRQYTIQPTNGSSRITVPLESKNGTRIDSWHATYSVNGETQPVEQNADAPVYYTESSSSVTFHFSNGAVEDNASVSFTAEPTFFERAQHSAESYASGWGVVWDALPFAVSPTEVVA